MEIRVDKGFLQFDSIIQTQISLKVKMLFPSSSCTEQSKSPDVVPLMYTDLITKNDFFLKDSSQSTGIFDWNCFYSDPCSQLRFNLYSSTLLFLQLVEWYFCDFFFKDYNHFNVSFHTFANGLSMSNILLF